VQEPEEQLALRGDFQVLPAEGFGELGRAAHAGHDIASHANSQLMQINEVTAADRATASP
jgi:hypothetical protein